MINHSKIIYLMNEAPASDLGSAMNVKQEIKNLPTEDLYALLGLHADATHRDITRAYRLIAMKCHPDLNHADSKKTEIFKLSTRAYTILSNPKKRAYYDRLVTPIWKRVIGKRFAPIFGGSSHSTNQSVAA